MRMFLDDLRDPPKFNRWGEPEKWDVICRTAEEAILLVRAGNISFIAFDHDLADGHDGIAVAKEIERLAESGKIKPIGYSIHSGNIVGAGNIDAAMKSAWRIWNADTRDQGVSETGVTTSCDQATR